MIAFLYWLGIFLTILLCLVFWLSTGKDPHPMNEANRMGLVMIAMMWPIFLPIVFVCLFAWGVSEVIRMAFKL